MARIQEEMTKKCRFLRQFELNRRLLSAVDQSQNSLGTTPGMWTIFIICLKFTALIVFDLLRSQNLDKLNFFYASLVAAISRPLRKVDIV